MTLQQLQQIKKTIISRVRELDKQYRDKKKILNTNLKNVDIQINKLKRGMNWNNNGRQFRI